MQQGNYRDRVFCDDDQAEGSENKSSKSIDLLI